MEQVDDTFESVTNKVGAIRRERFNDRTYIVADMTILPGDGVLNGSQGSLFYPANEVAANPGVWNHQPLVIYHPTDSQGRNISARTPKVLEDYGVGYVFNDRWDGEARRAEAWFDEEKLIRVENRLKSERPKYVPVHPRLQAGQPIELSTGLFTKNHIAANGSQSKGKSYTHIARNYVPDHLAILPDQKGACSVADGCGVNNSEQTSLLRKIGEKLGIVNSTTHNVETPKTEVQPTDNSNQETTVNREQTIQFLTTNCDCWKGKEKVLSNKDAFTDEDLAKLKLQQDELSANQLVVNSLREELGEPDLTTNEMPAFIKDKMAKGKKKPCDSEDEEEDDEMPAKKPPMIGNTDAFKDFLKLPAEERLTANERETLAFADSLKDQVKRSYVDRLVANNAKSEASRKIIRPTFEAMTINQLKVLVKELPEPGLGTQLTTANHEEMDTVLDFVGASGGFAANRRGEPEVDPDNILDL